MATKTKYVLMHTNGQYLQDMEKDPHGYGTWLVYWTDDRDNAMEFTREAAADGCCEELNSTDPAHPWSVFEEKG